MKRSEIFKVVMNSNVLVVFAVAASMLFGYLSDIYYGIRGISTVLQVVFAVLFAVYVDWRIIYKKQRIAVLLSSLMIVFETVLVQMKYSFFVECETISRYIWYAYYIPYILIPLFILYASMYIGEENRRSKNVMILTSVISAVLIALILTNDCHQWVFRFNAHFADWDTQYTYGFLFVFIYAWIVVLFFDAFVALLKKSRIIIGKKYSWQVLFYVGIGWLFLTVDAVTNLQEMIFGTRLVSNSFLFCSLSVSFILTCIRLWLIPAEVDYYMLNNSIEEVNEQLKEESEIIRLRNELQHEQLVLKEKNALYDEIAQSVSEQSEKILQLTKNNDNLPLICFYGVYIKRLSNLKLIAFDNAQMSVFELLLSVRESEKYLEKVGIPTSLTGYSERFVKSEIVVKAYQYMQYIIESNLNMLKGVSVTFPQDGTVLMRTVLEGIALPTETLVLTDGLYCSRNSEDDVSYITLSVGGKKR